MKKVIFLLVFISCFISKTNAQDTINVNSVFKMHLFLDRFNIKSFNVSRNDILYNTFSKNINLSFDTLKTYEINQKYSFYSLDAVNDISYNSIPQDDSELFFYIYYGFVSKYVICIDNTSGMSYRLMGFNGNDFLNFLSDYREFHNSKGYNDYMSDKKFLKECKVEGLDFQCLYKGLHDKNWNKNRYPNKYSCLQRVSDPIVIYD